jgi:DNA-binding MarR family transcriptional regulator
MRIFFNRWHAVSAADVVGGVFIAQREFLKSLRSHALPGSGLTAEIAEILFELFLADGNLSSPGHIDAEGYISMRDLLAALGYSPGLLSRRIGWLSQRHWVETKRAAPSIVNGLHGNCQKVRITEMGNGIIAPVWRRCDDLARRVLTGISPEDLAAHYRINELISDRLRAPRFLTDDSEPPKRTAKVSVHKPNPTAAKAMATASEPATKKYLLEPQSEFLD